MNHQRFLFVCTANVCRSVMAEKLLQKLAVDLGLPWQAQSCGMAVEFYYRVPKNVRLALASKGIADFDHKPQLVNRELLRWCDQALTMEQRHLADIRGQFPEFGGKLRLFAGLAGVDGDIQDPIGKPKDEFTACCNHIEGILNAFAAAPAGYLQRNPLSKTAT